MSKNKRTAHPLQVSVMAAMLVAVSIICGKFLQLPMGEIMRFSLENLPILLAGMAFGPLLGGMVGLVADVVGSYLRGYVLNPLVTVGALAIGLLGGVFYRVFRRLPTGWRVTLTTAFAHLVGSVGIKTVGLAAYYPVPLGALFWYRLINYSIVGTIEVLLLVTLFKNRGIVSMLKNSGGSL